MAKMAELAGFDYIPDSIGEDETGTTNITMEAFYESASQADYIIYLWSLGGKPATLAELVAMDEILADFKAVRDGNVWCTTQEFFQINDRLGTAIEDFSEMQTTGADELDYLFKLK
jgi:iron complex transport system substrate-binding protein